MNRQRRDKFYKDYLRHLPRVPVNAPFEPGELHHLAVFHDDWCAIFKGKECNCNPIIERYVERRRS
jgi:hypothetical protein